MKKVGLQIQIQPYVNKYSLILIHAGCAAFHFRQNLLVLIKINACSTTIYISGNFFSRTLKLKSLGLGSGLFLSLDSLGFLRLSA